MQRSTDAAEADCDCDCVIDGWKFCVGASGVARCSDGWRGTMIWGGWAWFAGGLTG